MYAHYFKSGKAHQLIISEDTRPTGKTINVESKKAAKAYVKENNLTAWNF